MRSISDEQSLISARSKALRFRLSATGLLLCPIPRMDVSGPSRSLFPQAYRTLFSQHSRSGLTGAKDSDIMPSTIGMYMRSSLLWAQTQGVLFARLLRQKVEFAFRYIF